MKTLIRFLLFAVCIALFATCQKADQVTDDLSGAQLKQAQPVTVTVPFEAELIGTYSGSFSPGDPDFTCGPPFECRVLVDAEGTATHMGKITAHFDFCACGPDDPDIPAVDNQYGPADAVFMAADGDKLFVSCIGSVVLGRLPHHPEDVNSYWHDPFVITGGTGRFEGASGGGFTDDFNRDSYPANSFHHWTGTITLVKGKGKVKVLSASGCYRRNDRSSREARRGTGTQPFRIIASQLNGMVNMPYGIIRISVFPSIYTTA